MGDFRGYPYRPPLLVDTGTGADGDVTISVDTNLVSTLDGDAVQVTITPTYTGCPAMHMIGLEIETALADSGAFTYRDYSAGTTLVWLSYPADNEVAENDELGTVK